MRQLLILLIFISLNASAQLPIQSIEFELNPTLTDFEFKLKQNSVPVVLIPENTPIIGKRNGVPDTLLFNYKLFFVYISTIKMVYPFTVNQSTSGMNSQSVIDVCWYLANYNGINSYGAMIDQDVVNVMQSKRDEWNVEMLVTDSLGRVHQFISLHKEW